MAAVHVEGIRRCTEGDGDFFAWGGNVSLCRF